MALTAIEAVTGRRVWDSRGRPTVEAEVLLVGGAVGRAIAPAGASTGSAEALDLRDGGPAFGGLDVRRALSHVNGEIARALRGVDSADQAAVDAAILRLDGSRTKERLGGNATIAVSMAAAHAAAAAKGVPLWRHLGAAVPRVPVPEIQIVGGGAHAAGRIDVQDFMVIATGAASISEALDWTAEVYRAAGSLLKARGRLRGIADEGGWWPELDSNEAALELVADAVSAAGFTLGREVSVSIDVAATQMRKGNGYELARDRRTVSADELGELLARWTADYRIVAIEDPVAEDDSAGMTAFTARMRGKCLIVGDDFLATTAERIRAAAAASACDTALIKPNQAGTLTETAAAFQAARDAGWRTIVSARSGESEDVTLVHLAAAWGADLFKVGSFARGERTAKWNEALRLSEAAGATFTPWRAPVDCPREGRRGG